MNAIADKSGVLSKDSLSSMALGRFLNPRLAIVMIAVVAAVMTGLRVFQQIFAWKTGLDSTTPEFANTWMVLLKGELITIPLLWAGTWTYLWVTRDRHLDQLKPKDELRRYMNLILWILVYAFCVYFAGSLFAEQDASWHQTVVRDTSFTPSHIVLFYNVMPLYVTFGVGSFLYAMTRLPKFAARISVPFLLVVVGPFLILPNLGYNEWGHAFWLMEEIFTAPLHWGFVVMGWSLVALGGLLVQLVQHMADVFGRIAAEEPTSA